MQFDKMGIMIACLMALFVFGAPGFAADHAKTTDTMTAEEKVQHKKHMLETAEKTLAEIYAKDPKIKKTVEAAYGYAVFTNTGFNLAIFVGGSGHGVAFKKGDKTPVFMAMKRAGTGPGLGYVNYRQVITFANELLFDEFTTVGMQGSASANLTMKGGATGTDVSGQMSLVPGVTFYQVTDEGFDIQANWGGMLYYKDTTLD
jgi:lipid-binding SYLF domain-containing protein